MSTTSPPGTQQSLTDALAAAPVAEEPEPTVTDDRVIAEPLTCACGRPAGADGQCTPCRMEAAGDAIGNHGRRL